MKPSSSLSNASLSTADRIVSIDSLASLIATEKANGKIVVATNGVFDFIHKGHISYLERTRELGDLLVIALNSDASTRRIKGEGRPINAELDRAFALASLRCVDYVCIFEEDTAAEVLNALKPSIYTKGGDYKAEDIPETPIVRANGGDVVIVPLLDGYSNSKQYKKIRDTHDDPSSRKGHVAGR